MKRIFLTCVALLSFVFSGSASSVGGAQLDTTSKPLPKAGVGEADLDTASKPLPKAGASEADLDTSSKPLPNAGAGEAELDTASRPLPKAVAGETVVELVPTKVRRRGRLQITFDANGKPTIIMPKPVSLVRGELLVDTEKAVFYLPSHGPYSLKSEKSHSLENTSTAISVDFDNDGKLANSEIWWSSMPVRLGDRMFEIKEIDPGGKWILLAKSSVPLAGAVIGKPCPPFEFTLMDGKPVSLKDYKGTAVLLDVWSMT